MDAHLWARVKMLRNTDHQRFEALLRGNIDALYRTALRLSRDPSAAESLVQDASLRAYRAFVTGTAPDNFRAWVFRILINLHIDHSRRPKQISGALEVDELPSSNHGPAQNFANARLGQDLSAAVDALTDELRLVVQLVLVEGMSYREASDRVLSR